MTFLKRLWKLYEVYIDVPVKRRLTEWSQRPARATFSFKKWLGGQYIKTRSSLPHADLWGYFIIPGCVVLVLVLLSSPLWAEDITISWIAPTGQEQCTPITEPPALRGYRILQVVATIDDPAQLSYVIPAQLPGEYTYLSTAVDTNGAESKLSNEATKIVTLFSVSEQTAYTMARIENAFILLPIGTVPIGTACDVNQSVNGKYVVHVDNVTWTSTNEAYVVVADCS